MDDEESEDEPNGDRPPPVDGMEYPEKPEDATAMEIMQWMERVDAYWSKRGFQRLKDEDEEDDDEEHGPTDDDG